MRLEDWSLLTILLMSNAALWSDGGETERGLGGPLPHVRREARRKVRAQHRSATYEPASRTALSGFGKVAARQTDLGLGRRGIGKRAQPLAHSALSCEACRASELSR
jgi:hypothetical protein